MTARPTEQIQDGNNLKKLKFLYCRLKGGAYVVKTAVWESVFKDFGELVRSSAKLWCRVFLYFLKKAGYKARCPCYSLKCKLLAYLHYAIRAENGK